MLDKEESSICGVTHSAKRCSGLFLDMAASSLLKMIMHGWTATQPSPRHTYSSICTSRNVTNICRRTEITQD